MSTRRCEVCGEPVEKGLLRKTDSNYWVEWKEKNGYSLFGLEFAGKLEKTYYHTDCIEVNKSQKGRTK